MMETACHPVIQLMVKRANPDGGTIEFQAQPEGTVGRKWRGPLEKGQELDTFIQKCFPKTSDLVSLHCQEGF